MSKSVIEVLTEARANIERGWCQGSSALSATGMKVRAESPEACRWCSSGAIGKAVNGHERIWMQVFKVLDNLVVSDFTGYRGAVHYNDSEGRTQAEVVALFDRAIERAKEAANA